MLLPYQIMLVDLAIFFGQYVIVAAALNFQYGNAGIPNMSNHISVACESLFLMIENMSLGALLLLFMIKKPGD
jgi:hypothetical protein